MVRACLAFIVLLTGATGCLSESRFSGHPTSYWKDVIARGPIPLSRGHVVWFDAYTLVPASGWDALKRAFGLPYCARPYMYPLRDGDPAAVPVLAELLSDSNPSVRMYAAETLGDLGADAKPAIAALKRVARDPAIGSFGATVGEKAREALRAIIDAPASPQGARK